ncbi:MAG: MFS transporter [Candidatus Omnitrophica bacterium]|nr:MFS transporter [Candidatus Omnitrophota bacterium]
MDPKQDTQKTSRSLKFSFRDGIFASAMIGFTQDYFTPFLLLLGGTVRHVGMLNALPNLFGSLIQVKSADITEKIKSRRKTINIFVFIQAFMLLPMAIVALRGGISPAVFIAFVTLFASCGAISTPAWGSLMSDLVAKERRGEYFGWRNRILGLIIIGSALIAGFILYFMKKINVFYGFGIIFSLAFLYRLISWYYLKRMHEPPIEYKKENYFNLIDFLARIRESNFAKFVLFVAAMNFSINLASPFFAVLMLKDLQFNYLLYTLITITATLTLYLMISRWGRHADKVGNLKIIRFTAPLIGITPLLWIFNHNPIFLIFVQIYSGFLWAGFSLCTTNFIYDAVMPEKRARCISYFNVLNGLALSCGALIGGFLLRYLPPLFGYKIFMLFLISSVLRIAIGAFMPMKLKEVRPVERIDNNALFFSIIGMKPLLGVERKIVRF